MTVTTDAPARPTPRAEPRPLLDIIVEHVGQPLPDGCDTWGIRAVHPDLRSSNGFRWPWPSEWAEAPGPILDHRGSCPQAVGDGLCTATTAAGMASGRIHAHTVLLTAHASADVVGDSEPGKLRLRRALVVEVVDLPGLARGAKLAAADLAGAYLGGAYLGGAYLRAADLAGANLRGAYLRGAYLGGADLAAADLAGAYLGAADLRGAYLAGADLGAADLGGANLGGAYLRGAYLGGAYLRGAYLAGAYLGAAYLRGANLGGWERGPDGYARKVATP